MKYLLYTFLVLIGFNSFAGENKIYNVNGNEYEGYWSKASDTSPLVLLVHDWDGLTEYEVKRSEMLSGFNFTGIK